MLLTALSLLLLAGAARSEYVYGKPTNGKLVHDMRTFVNVTFDWSSKIYGTKDVAIPLCHEWRIRRSYYELELKDYTEHVNSHVRSSTEEGHFVYPLVITVSDPKKGQSEHFAAAIHNVNKRSSGKEDRETDEPLIQIAIISKQIWKRIWNRWTTAGKNTDPKFAKFPRVNADDRNSTEFCEGGAHFDDLLPKIRKDQNKFPRYENIVNQGYTDLISDACDAKTCGCPTKQSETLTFAYPTSDGLRHLLNTSYYEDGDLRRINSQKDARIESDYQMCRAIRACYDKEDFAYRKRTYKGDTLIDDRIKSNYHVFYPPFE